MTRAGFSNLLYPGLNKVYTTWLQSYPSEFEQFLNVDSMTQYKIEDTGVAGFGLVPEKTEGDQPTFDVLKMYDKVAYISKTYVMGYEVTEECMEDELYGVIQKASKALAIAVKQTNDTLGAAVLNNAFSGSYLGMDGKALCALDHPQKKAGGTVANKPATAVDFDPTSLQSALETWEGWTDDNALPMLMKPKWVVSGPLQRRIITQTLGSDLEPFTSDNEKNGVKEWELQKMILHYLTDPDAWFLLSQKAEHYLNWFWRIKPKFRGYDDPNTGNARYLVRWRSTCGFTHWHGVYGTPGI
jgi:phage major head subunit gpT-like protein